MTLRDFESTGRVYRGDFVYLTILTETDRDENEKKKKESTKRPKNQIRWIRFWVSLCFSSLSFLLPAIILVRTGWMEREATKYNVEVWKVAAEADSKADSDTKIDGEDKIFICFCTYTYGVWDDEEKKRKTKRRRRMKPRRIETTKKKIWALFENLSYTRKTLLSSHPVFWKTFLY